MKVFGSTRVSDAAYQVSRSLAVQFQRRRFFKLEMSMMGEFANNIDEHITDTFDPDMLIRMHQLTESTQECKKPTDDVTSKLQKIAILMESDKVVSTFLKKVRKDKVHEAP